MSTLKVGILFLLCTAIAQQPQCNEDYNCTEACREQGINPLKTAYASLPISSSSLSSVSAVTCNHSIPHYGPYKYECTRLNYGNNPGFICGEQNNDGDKNGYLCYPTNLTLSDLPIVSFVHGFTSGGVYVEGNYSGLFKTWASWGIVTVAPESCVNGACLNLFYDQQTAIMEPESNPSMHPVFSRVNFSKKAIAGHSMGGTVTMEASGQWMQNYMYSNFTARAAVLLHPGMMCPLCQCNDMMKIPSMWTTGTADHIVSDNAVLSCYNQEKNKNVYPKILADLIDANHFEPVEPDGGHLAPYMAQFMLCILNDDEKACNYIYGSDNNSLCNACNYKHCIIDKSEEIV